MKKRKQRTIIGMAPGHGALNRQIRNADTEEERLRIFLDSPVPTEQEKRELIEHFIRLSNLANPNPLRKLRRTSHILAR